ncbi:beta-mannosidase [Nonlabens xiamenensis]|uniref:beta-mannosidase n=1 Tax=Nonlabens xiamenensis TaxID=2341043 RepID=UPI000F610CF1|nr:glycoside hydrolase family 2 protein [Nonlabens xiamenensis]
MRNINRINIFLLALAAMSISCTQRKELPRQISLNDQWSLFQVKDGHMVRDSISLPTSVQSDLWESDHIPDPFVGNNEEKIGWVSQENWRYEKEFAVSKEELHRDHIYLQLDGLNTYARVMLNDSLIHQNDNAFTSERIFVKNLLKENNKLTVELLPTTPFEKAEDLSHPYTLPLVNSDNNHRVFTRKGQFEYGWDWGPVLNTMGISQPIYLQIYDGLKIEEVDLRQELLTDSLASLTSHVKLADLSAFEELELQLYVNDSLLASSTYLGPNQAAQQFSLPFTIKKPKRWWPHNLGDPYLYDIKIKMIQDGVLSDEYRVKKGLRTVELVNEKDSIGESFYFKINDVPVYAKGANYIPQNSMLDRVKDQDYLRLIQDAKKANMNMLRAWGGGVYQKDLFYEICDREGIMVWQDFMFACAMYPGDKRFRESVKQEATQQVKRLRKHPSLVLFNGNNEINEAWHNWGWQAGRSDEEKEYIWNEYQSIFVGVLPAVVSAHSDLPYWESSPKFGRGDKRYETHANAHDWWVWHSGYPFEHYENHVPRFSSEFGFQSHPSFQTIRYINASDSLDIHSADYASHQKHPRGNALIADYMQRDFPVPDQDAGFVYMSQLLQAYGISKAIHAQRRARPRSMGTLYWQLNDCWPVVSWSSIDFLGHWKALHYTAKRDFNNLLISTELQEDSLNIWLVNDDLLSFNSPMRVDIFDFNGKSISSFRENVKAPANNSAMVMQIPLDLKSASEKEVYIQVSFKDRQYWDYLVRPKELKLPQPDYSIAYNWEGDRHKITLFAHSFLKDVFLYSEESGHFSDNFFDLPKGTSKTLYFDGPEFIKGFEVMTLNEFILPEENPARLSN